MKFALFFMSEYIKLIAMNAIAVMLFLGGWQLPGLTELAAAVSASAGDTIGAAVFGLTSLGAFLLKVTVLSFVSVWMRATLPRVRYDQLMNLGWKVLLPLALVNVAVTAVVNVLLPDAALPAALLTGGIGLVVLLIGIAISQPARPASSVTLIPRATRQP